MTSTKTFSIMDSEEAFAVPGESSIIDVISIITGRSWYADETLEQIRLRYPTAVIVNLDKWCEGKAALQDAAVTWHPITEERYYDALECLPPIDQSRHGFLIGEPSDHHATNGQARYSACIIKGGRFFESSRPMTIKEFRAHQAA